MSADGTVQLLTGERLAHVDAAFEQHLEYAAKAEDHVWVAISAHRLSDDSAKGIAASDATVPPLLDLENLATLQVGCYRCERALERRLIGKRCRGRR